MVELEVARYIREKGFKQKVVAEKLGISSQVMSNVMAGKRRLTAEEYGNICEFLGVPYSYFFSSDPDGSR